MRLRLPVKERLMPGVFAMAGLLTLLGIGVPAQSPEESNNRRDIEEAAMASGERQTDFLDKVYVGDTDSERDRVSVIDASVIEGGLDVPAREVTSDGGEITVELACDPEEENFVTMRLWGGNPSATHLSAAVEGTDVSTWARVEEPNVGDRFFYVTMAIPSHITAGRESVEVTLTAGNDSPDHAYAVYTHAENFYTPPAEETQGEPLEEPDGEDPDFDTLRENLMTGADQAIDYLRGKQNTNEDDPSKYGNVGGISNRRGAMAADNFLRAYTLKGSKYQGNDEMIERALLNFDHYCRYQGYRGAVDWQSWAAEVAPWDDEEWGIGSGLPGFIATHLGRGFIRAIPIFRERPELLEVEIDANGDGEANTTRHEAYTRFWRDYLWENMLTRWGIGQKVWNQITVNGTSMIQANEILKYLSPEDAAPDDIILKQARAKAGILPIDDEVIDFVLELQVRNDGEYGTAPGSLEEGRHYENKHWHWSGTRHYYPISQKGIGIEFGYSPGYSFHMRNIFMAQVADDRQINDQVRLYFNGMQHFIYPTTKQTGHRWARVGAIGERNRGWPWKPFGLREKTAGAIYAALELESEPAKRIVREQLRHMGNLDGRDWNWGHALQVNGIFRWLEHFPELREWYENEEPTGYRLPAERKGPYAWCDEIVGLVMIQDSAGTHYLEQMDPTQQRRYHRITDEYRAFGDAKSHFCQATHVETAQVGPYEIVMNRSNTRDVRVKGGPRPYISEADADGLVDLISGKTVNPAADTLVGANESLVLDRRRRVEAPATNQQPNRGGATVNESTMTKHWKWSVPEGRGEGDVYSMPLDDSAATAQIADYYEYAVTRGTRQHANQMVTFYRPEIYEEGTPISVRTAEGEHLAVETVNGCQNRLVVEQPAEEANTIEATGILPTFESYGAWSVDNTGFASSSVSTEEALAVEVVEETEITDTYPLTFTLPIEKPVDRIVFLHESNFDPSSLQMVLEADDGRTLWEGTHPNEIVTMALGGRIGRRGDSEHVTDELVNLEDVHVEDALHFRVRRNVASESMDDKWYRELTDGAKMSAPEESTKVSDGWYRRIRDVRIEYADGTARYPSR